MSAFSSCDTEREFEAGIWEGENEPVLETLMGIWTLLSQTCLWRRKDEDAYLEIHNAGDRNDYPRSIRDRYQYPPVAWQWWEGWGFTSWGDEQWMFATLEGSEGAPLVGEYEKNNHSHRLAKLSLWQHSGWSQTWIKIVPNHGQCTIIYIVECKKKKRERGKKSNNFCQNNCKKSLSWPVIWRWSQTWACEQNALILHTRDFKWGRNSSIFHTLLAQTP